MSEETVNNGQTTLAGNNITPTSVTPKYVLTGSFLPLLGTWSGTWLNEGEEHAKPAPFRFNRVMNEEPTPIPTISVVIPSGDRIDLPITSEWKGSFNVFLPNNRVRSFNDHASVTLENPNLPNSPNKVLHVVGQGHNSVGQYSLTGEFTIADASMQVTRVYTGPPKQREAQRARVKSTPVATVPNTLKELLENELSGTRISTRAASRKNSFLPDSHGHPVAASPYNTAVGMQGSTAYPALLDGFDFSVFSPSDRAHAGTTRVGKRKFSADPMLDNLHAASASGSSYGGRPGSGSLPSTIGLPLAPSTPYTSGSGAAHHLSAPGSGGLGVCAVIGAGGLLASPLVGSPLPPPLLPRLVAYAWDSYPPCSNESELQQAFLVQSSQLLKLFSLPWKVCKELLKFFKQADAATPAATPLPSPAISHPLVPTSLSAHFDGAVGPQHGSPLSNASATTLSNALLMSIDDEKINNAVDKEGSEDNKAENSGTSSSPLSTPSRMVESAEPLRPNVPVIRGKERFERVFRDLSSELPQSGAHGGSGSGNGNGNNGSQATLTVNISGMATSTGSDSGLPSPRSSAPTIAPTALGAGVVQRLQEIAQLLQQHESNKDSLKSENGESANSESITTDVPSEDSLRSERKTLLGYIQQLSSRGLLFQLYTGPLLHGLPTGYGVCVYPPSDRVPNGVASHAQNRNVTGRMYEGEWVAGVPHGTGVLSTVDGDMVYMGQFSNGRFHGVGVYIYEDGSVYKGLWKDGLPHGIGCLIRSRTEAKIGRGDVAQEEKDHKPVDNTMETGKLSEERATKKPQIQTSAPSTPRDKRSARTAPQPSKPTTSLSTSQSSEQITASTLQVLFNEPLVYLGTWSQGLRNGIGMQTYSNGTVYKGHWVNGQRHGTGVTRCLFPPDARPPRSRPSSTGGSWEGIRTPVPHSPKSSLWNEEGTEGLMSVQAVEEQNANARARKGQKKCSTKGMEAGVPSSETVEEVQQSVNASKLHKSSKNQRKLSFLPTLTAFDAFPAQTFLFSNTPSISSPPTSQSSPTVPSPLSLTEEANVLYGVYISGCWQNGSLSHGTATLAQFHCSESTLATVASGINLSKPLQDCMQALDIHPVSGTGLFDLPSGVTVSKLDRYRGEFCNGKRHGYGLYEFGDSQAIASGLWDMDEFLDAIPIPTKFIPPFQVRDAASLPTAGAGTGLSAVAASQSAHTPSLLAGAHSTGPPLPASKSVASSPRIPLPVSPAASPKVAPPHVGSPASVPAQGASAASGTAGGDARYLPLNLEKPNNPPVYFPHSFVLRVEPDEKKDAATAEKRQSPPWSTVTENRRRKRTRRQVTKESIEFCPPEEEENILFCIPIQPTNLL